MNKRKIIPAGLLRVEIDRSGSDEPVIYISALDTEGEDEQALIVWASELEALLQALEIAKIELRSNDE